MAVTAEQLNRQSGERGHRTHRRAEVRAADGGKQPSRETRTIVSWVHIITATVVIFLLGLGLVVTQTLIGNLGFELALLRGELREAQARTGHLKTQVAALAAPGRIADIAEAELGMIPAERAAPQAFAEMTDPAAQTGVPGERAAGDAGAGDDGSNTRRVVLHLQAPEREAIDGVSLADVGAWFLRWLRGAPPVRASSR